MKCKFENCERTIREENQSGFCEYHYRVDYRKRMQRKKNEESKKES